MLSVNFTSAEWHHIQPAAAKHLHGETLSRAEIVRRYTLAGTQILGNASPEDQARLAYKFQPTMTVTDTRLGH